MSKLLDAIQVHRGSSRRPSPARPMLMLTVTEDETAPSQLDCRREYRMEARFGATMWIDEIQASVPSVVERAKRTMSLALVDQVFGEFRGPISQALMALHNGDCEEAMKHVYDLQRLMFSEN